MRPLRRPVLALGTMAVVLMICHRGWATAGLQRWLDSYIDDILFLPIVLSTVLVALRAKRREPAWTVPWPLGIAALVLYSVYFEVILPQFSALARRDFWDVMAYTLGFFMFMLVINHPAGAGLKGEK